jgi:hypothetical protein
VICMKLHLVFKHSDIDECATDTDNCDANAFCTNTNGSFTCTCNAGYTGSGVQCQGEPACLSSLP